MLEWQVDCGTKKKMYESYVLTESKFNDIGAEMETSLRKP